MFRLRFFKTIVGLLAGIATVHYLALSYALYVLIPNLDTLVHASAGFVLGITTISLYEKFHLRENVQYYYVKLFVLVFLVAIVIGLGWEVFEKMIGFTPHLDMVDTTTDLIADMAGAFIGYGIYRFIQWGK